MKVYHRLIGDPPKRGFGNVIGSAGFPNGAAWADNKNAVRMSASVPFGLPEKAENGLIENHEAYEYQTLRFGQVALLRSVQGMSVVNGQYSRPHGYTHIAALSDGGEDSVITDHAEPCQLLSYDDFISLKDFWEIPADKDTIPPTDWQPPAKGSCVFAWKDGLSNDLLAALIARYWKAATKRAFDNTKDLYPVEVCLDDENNCRALIDHAKNFFAALIVPRLPRPAWNILSMSAAVPKKSIQMFSPTALVFLYPEKEIAPNDQFFDLRTGRFKPLGAEEAAFAAALLSGAGSPMLAEVFRLYKEETGCKDPEHCTFMADYDLAFAVDRIENDRIDLNAKPEDMLKLWRDMTSMLNTRHGIGPELCHAILAPMSNRIIKRLTEDTESAVPMDKSMLSFLFRDSVLSSGSEQESNIFRLICRHQSARLQPFFLDALPFKDLPDSIGYLTLAAARILSECFLQSLPGEEEMQKLTEPGFIESCTRFPETQSKMADYILQALEQSPESEAYLLPLSKHFVDGYGRLKQAIRLMCRNYVTAPPGDAACNNLRLAFRDYANEENRILLVEYLAKYFWAHRENMDEFGRVIRLTGVDTAKVLLKILDEALAPDHMDQPVTVPQMDSLLAVLPRDAERLALKTELLGYAKKVLDYSLQMGSSRFAWLCLLDRKGMLIDFPTRLDLCLKYAPACMARLGQPLPEQEFGMLFKLAKEAGRAFAQYENRILEAYNNLKDQGTYQASQLMDYFTNVSPYPYIRSVFLQGIKDKLALNWQEQQDYWGPVDEICGSLNKGNVSKTEVLDEATQKQARQTLGNILGKIKLLKDFEAALDVYKQRKKDLFGDFWREELRKVFVQRYPSLLAKDCLSRDDIQLLENVRQTLAGSTADASIVKAVSCATAVLDTWKFLESIDKVNVYERIPDIKKIRQRLSQCTGEGSRQPLGLLKQYFLDTGVLNDCSYMRKVAAGLLCTAWEDADSVVVAVLRLVGNWDKEAVLKPYKPESLDNLWAVSILFVSLEMFDMDLPKTLLDHLNRDGVFKCYTDNVRRNRKMMNSYYPWLSDRMHDFIPEPHSKLKSWLS
jgi:hypothetical protein